VDQEVKPRVLTLTQSTYDGVLYNTETIKACWTAVWPICTSMKPGCPLHTTAGGYPPW
jgi:arginine/lysine/ornithine decarboxylase